MADTSLIAHSQSTGIGLLSILALGFFLGMRHATDSDHVVAVSTIVAKERRLGSAALIGALWGAGHTATIFLVGVGIIVFGLVIPPRLGLSMEFSVGLMLVLLGWMNLRGLRKAAIGVSGKSQDSHSHSRHELARIDRFFKGWKVYLWARPLVIGCVHGLAGSAAVALLVLATIRSANWAVAYLLIFGVGTIAGMMVITMFMATAIHYAGERSRWINRRLSLATGVLSVAFGIFVLYQMGIVHGLFTAHPNWQPS